MIGGQAPGRESALRLGWRKRIRARIESEFETDPICRSSLPAHIKLAYLHVIMDDEALYAVEQGLGQIIQIQSGRRVHEVEPDGDARIAPAWPNIGHFLAKELV